MNPCSVRLDLNGCVHWTIDHRVRRIGWNFRRDMLERARKEVEAANGLNRQLSSVQFQKAAEVRRRRPVESRLI